MNPQIFSCFSAGLQDYGIAHIDVGGKDSTPNLLWRDKDKFHVLSNRQPLNDIVSQYM